MKKAIKEAIEKAMLFLFLGTFFQLVLLWEYLLTKRKK